MNKRQKAKYYKRMYEQLLMADKLRPMEVKTTRIPVQTYRITKAFGDFDIPDIDKDKIIRDFMSEDIAKLAHDSIKINEFAPNMYETTIRIAWE